LWVVEGRPGSAGLRTAGEAKGKERVRGFADQGGVGMRGLWMEKRDEQAFFPGGRQGRGSRNGLNGERRHGDSGLVQGAGGYWKKKHH